ncbi:hypothetical protein Leryth_002981 [Lithospermum erythrorhizon]|nr:hypothetical protein Leryth_002981 [Lithospermum erythrorhizon]
MLKSTLTPLLFTFPAKTKPTKLQNYLLPKNTHSQPVRQNASTNLNTPSPSHILPFNQPPTSAYIHLPFCRKRCHYCDFPIVALGSSSPETADNDPRIINYVQTICREIKGTIEKSGPTPPLETVFFGGGTPSLVPPRLVSSILDVLRAKFGLCSDAEISIEMDPGTFDGAKLNELMELGVNRVSLGVQAFQEELLSSCGRAHGVKEVFEAVEMVKSCGVDNWSLDLISSLPHQTLQMWEESLRLAIEAQSTHVSVYDLQVEQGTKFGKLYSPGEFPLPSEDQSAEFYRTASKMLTDAGFDHYEISSYSKSGYQCKHNLTYWKNTPFYGFGLGAASYLNGVRFSRPKMMKGYLGYVQDLENELLSSHDNGVTDLKDIASDVVMLSFRTARGLDLKSFKEIFGYSLVRSICQLYMPYVESGHIVCLDEQRRTITPEKFGSFVSDEHTEIEMPTFIRLSDPEGFLLSNELISLAFGVIAP